MKKLSTKRMKSQELRVLLKMSLAEIEEKNKRIAELVALRDEVAKYRRADKAFIELNEHLGIGGDV
jgi:hypothetical protein